MFVLELEVWAGFVNKTNACICVKNLQLWRLSTCMFFKKRSETEKEKKNKKQTKHKSMEMFTDLIGCSVFNKEK